MTTNFSILQKVTAPHLKVFYTYENRFTFNDPANVKIVQIFVSETTEITNLIFIV